jgi:hypothetical protein
VARWKRLLLYRLIGIATIAPPVTVLGMAINNELASSNWEDSHFKRYGCLESFSMVSSKAGRGFGVGPYVLHYQRGALNWESGSDTLGIILSVAASSPQDIWGVGIHAIGRYEGSQWQQTDIVPSSRLASVSMAPADDGWAVGARYADDEPQNGVLVHYQTGRWNVVVTTDRELNAISMTSPTDGWAVGTATKGNGVCYHDDGARWTLSATEPDLALGRASALNSREAWALGRSSGGLSILYHYAGAKWRAVAPPTDIVARSRYVGDDGGVWLTSETQQEDRDGFQQGVVLHDREGRWQTLAIPHRPLDEPWDLSPEYRFLVTAIPVQWVMLIAIWCIGYVRRKLQFHEMNREIRGALIGALGAFSATGLDTLLLWILYRISPDAIPQALVIAITIVLTVLLAFPTIYLAAPPLLMHGDGSLRWRRQT